MKNFSCTLLNSITLKHPLILASGISGNSDKLMVRAAMSGAAAVTTKGFTVKYVRGATNPVSTDWGCGLITNLGLTNPGVESMRYMIQSFRTELGDHAVPVFANIAGNNPEEFVEVAAKIAEIQPALIEVDFPNQEDALAAEIIQATVESAHGIPVSAKLSPDCCSIGKLAQQVVKAGASLISAINPIHGMLIDAYAKRPFLSTGKGWLSGPAIKPVALSCVSEIYQAVDVPIIGMGGVMSGLDMVELMMAGASVVGIGSALYYHGYHAFNQILNEFEDFMNSEGFKSSAELTGCLWRSPQA